jgi:hypothetical protein
VVDEAERNDALFVNLVVIFQGAAMQQMGKLTNPLTGKIEKNLEQARFSIDTLAMLREKTRGNLSEDLERLLDSALLNLRMNYVEEAASAKPDGETPGGETEAGPEPSPNTAAAAPGEASRPGETVTEEVTKERRAEEGGAGEAAGGGDAKAAPGARKPRRRRSA